METSPLIALHDLRHERVNPIYVIVPFNSFMHNVKEWPNIL